MDQKSFRVIFFGKDVEYMDHQDMMRRAIELAKNGTGAVDPNPLVGAVIVKDGRIIGEGYHARYGGLHAERNALASCKESPMGATLYVTLEPCCHYGKTPPCTEAILEAGIQTVYIGSRDPNPKVAGKGAAILRQAGINVIEDFLREECDTLNAPFFYYITRQRPYVAMKYAMTADGKIATATGASQWITNEESRRHVHLLRRKYQGIMAGIGTVLADDPMLSCRLGDGGRNPVRVICDSRLRIPLESKLVQSAKEIPLFIATCAKDAEKKAALEEKGVLVFVFEGQKVPLPELMDKLGELKIGSILLEGGGELNASMLEAGLVQRVYAYVGAKIFGGKTAKTPVSGRGIDLPAQSPALRLAQTEIFGDDVLCVYDVLPEKEAE